MSYAPWQQKMPPAIELVTVQLPGREARFNEPFATSVGDVVERMMAEFEPLRDLPYQIFGHSLGALLAFEFARSIERTGGRRPDGVIVSGKRAPQEKLTGVPIHSLPTEDFIRHVKDYKATPDEVVADAQLLELLVPRLRADFAMSETYCHRPGPRLASGLTCFGGEDDPETAAPLLEGWREQASGDFALQRFAGDHFFIFTNEDAFLTALSATLLPRRPDRAL